MSDFRKPLYKYYVSRFKKDSGFIGNRSSRLKKYHTINFLKLTSQYSKNTKILDVGCGSGQLLESLRESGFNNIEGIDISEEQVACANERGLPASCKDVFDHLGKSLGGYDIIFAIDLVEHFTREELGRLGNLFLKNLKPGGRLILQTPNGKSPFALRNIYGDFTHLCIFSDESIAQWLASSGFKNVYTTSSEPAPTQIRDHLRCLLRMWILMLTKVSIFMVTGRKEKDLGENLLVMAEKGD